ncbi:MAG: hypothetical protein E5Y59_02975 [Mesorhizobium sp.]|uniref:hypothetical protein n=1 Tax=Mesorhizobium sp. TaxID=1871066 RepID=UPI00120FD594|nr:hypothetical protein [Mesorhizobium sp.]TIL70371.1 MAG: hypothetical protein E5Y70_31285 [Mesorhizobium sp.]TIN20827.1 MAG: hypothetical protein E5Y59_02975 [Mesorhizobium sp.]
MTRMTAIPVITVMRARVTPISRASVTCVTTPEINPDLVDNRRSLSRLTRIMKRRFFLLRPEVAGAALAAKTSCRLLKAVNKRNCTYLYE